MWRRMTDDDDMSIFIFSSKFVSEKFLRLFLNRGRPFIFESDVFCNNR